MLCLLPPPHPHRQAYPKVSKIHYALLEILFRNHLNILAELDTRVVRFLVGSLAEGLQHHEAAVSSTAATALDHLFTYTWKLAHKRDPPAAHMFLSRHLSDHRDVCQSILNTMFNMVRSWSWLLLCALTFIYHTNIFFAHGSLFTGFV
jgi:hypothetical protein